MINFTKTMNGGLLLYLVIFFFSLRGKIISGRVKIAGSRIRLSDLLAMWSQQTNRFYVSLIFHICKMGTLIALTL